MNPLTLKNSNVKIVKLKKRKVTKKIPTTMYLYSQSRKSDPIVLLPVGFLFADKCHQVLYPKLIKTRYSECLFQQQAIM
jgi:hypothetical protein